LWFCCLESSLTQPTPKKAKSVTPTSLSHHGRCQSNRDEQRATTTTSRRSPSEGHQFPAELFEQQSTADTSLSSAKPPEQRTLTLRSPSDAITIAPKIKNTFIGKTIHHGRYKIESKLENRSTMFVAFDNDEKIQYKRIPLILFFS
jgi:hypothetical protein